MERIRRFIVHNLWWLVLLTAGAMLVAHIIKLRFVVIDNTTLLLLVVILVSPFVAAIRKIKIGDFEAEIEAGEVKEVARLAEQSLPARTPETLALGLEEQLGSEIKDLADADPVLALAKLRIELETRLRKLYSRVKPDSSTQKRPANLGSIVRELMSRDTLSRDFGAAIRNVIEICNRAVHGEDIRDVDAKQIINTGIDLLGALEVTLHEFLLTHPLETTVVTGHERDELAESKYKVTTIVPYVEKPERRVYVLTQQELDDFLDGYSEYAEFLVSLERTEDHTVGGAV